MILDDLMSKKGMSRYRLAVTAGIPHATLNDLCSGKTKLERCSAETMHKLSKALGVSMASVRPNVSVRMNMVSQIISSTISTHIKKD